MRADRPEPTNPPLFHQERLSDYLDKQAELAKAEANKMSEAEYRQLGLDAAIDQIVARYHVSPLELDLGGITASHEERQIHRHDEWRGGYVMVPGQRITLHVPLGGSAVLLGLQPNTYDSNPPRGRAGRGAIDIAVDVARGEASESKIEEARRGFQRVIEYANNQRPMITEFNAKLPAAVRGVLSQRIKSIDQNSSALAKLGIPLRTKSGAPALPMPMKQEIKLERATTQSPNAPAKPDPFVSDKDYGDILSLIRHQCATFEEAPAAFRSLDEEQLRDVIRASLKAVYRSAGAELFRNKGKTDICIEQENRAAFVAECKVWAGGKGLRDAIDQLLGYLTWRDCRTSIVLFNKDRANFQDLLAKIPAEYRRHTAHVRDVEATPKLSNEWRIVLRHPSGHEVLCHIMIFDLPAP